LLFDSLHAKAIEAVMLHVALSDLSEEWITGYMRLEARL
jgi:hypothetical protein